jgi:hypothetical protein
VTSAPDCIIARLGEAKLAIELFGFVEALLRQERAQDSRRDACLGQITFEGDAVRGPALNWNSFTHG